MSSIERINKRDQEGQLAVNGQQTFLFVDNSEEANQQFKENLASLWKDGTFTDLTLKVGLKEISCHRVVVAAGSSYLKELLQIFKSKDVNLSEHSAEVVEAALQYIYTGRAEVPSDLVVQLSKLSDTFQLRRLSNACDEFLSDRIEVANCLGFYTAAMKYKLHKTEVKAHHVMLTWPEEILQIGDTQWKAIDMECFKEWISSADLKAPSETLVYELVEKWIIADEERQNEECAAQTLALVRLHLCPTDFLINTVETSIFMKWSKCRDLLNKAKTYMLLPELKRGITPRNYSKEYVILLGGCSGDEQNTKCYIRNDGQWHSFTNIPAQHSSFTDGLRACVMVENIVISGGIIPNSTDSATNSAFRYNTITNQWHSMPPMIYKRHCHGLVSLNNTIYALGGLANGLGIPALNTSEKFDPIKKEWMRISPMLGKGGSVGAGVVRNNVYAVTFHQGNTSTQMYNTVTGNWERKADMPRSFDGSAATLDGYMYIAGGLPPQCLRYNTKTDSWSVLIPPAPYHFGSSVMAYNSNILISGGLKKESSRYICTDTVEQYDPSADMWTLCQYRLPDALAGHCMVKVKQPLASQSCSPPQLPPRAVKSQRF